MSSLLKVISALVLALLAAPSGAVIQITITEAPERATPIAVVDFGWSGPAPYAPERIADIVAADLGRSGRFAPLAAADMPGRPSEDSDIRWADWRRLQIGNLVVGKVTQEGPSGAGVRYSVEFRLHDAFKEERLAGLKYTVSAGQLRKVAHQIADTVYEALTGEPGAFDTQIAYVKETSDISGSRYYSLVVADSDGHNQFAVLESRQPIMSPAWSRGGKRLAYVSFEGGAPSIYVQELASTNRRKVAGFPGINGAPAWSPDDSRLALTLSKDGNPEIYVLHLSSGILRRMTENVGIDTEPAWSPDGRSILFTSDRGGRPQIYRMSVNGGQAERLTFEGKYNARPTYTPDGKRIAMVHGNEGVYRIALLDPDAGRLTVLTSSQLDESPTVSPNGRMVLYATTERGRAALAVVAIDGGGKYLIGESEGGVRDPAWSPYLR